jgi:HSP20 family protein
MINSFFSRLTGSQEDRFDDFFDEERPVATRQDEVGEWGAEEPAGELAVDVYQNPDSIIVKALIAGVQPSSIDISLTREMVTISGRREEEREVEDHNYFHRELYWGTFSRTIVLPEEIDPDHAEASEKHGVLILRLPKINKSRETKLKVRSR